MKLLKLKAGRYKIPTRVILEKNRLYLDFPYNKDLLAEIKLMQGRKYHGFDEENPRKIWSIPNTARNRFQLAYLSGLNPYAKYDDPLADVVSERPLYKHQFEMKAHGLTRRQCIFACEMRTGKTLAAIEILEESGYPSWIWVGPKSAIAGVQVEFNIWKAKVRPTFLTYRKFTIMVEKDELFIPHGIVFDECSHLRTPTSKRTQAAFTFVEQMREQDPDCFIIGMSGSPAPKDPGNWWSQCEIACPGYLVEGDIHKFKHRLGLVKQVESIDGGAYPKLVTWFDDEKKCAVCGQYPEAHGLGGDHDYKFSKNEVAYFYKRAKGLVLVKFKQDCLDLPEKQYRLIEIEPTPEIRKAESLILETEPRAVTALMKLRELSDGFQYQETRDPEHKVQCPVCKGSGEDYEWFDPEYPDEAPNPENPNLQKRKIKCEHCSGAGQVAAVKRMATRIKCPKDDVLLDLLEEHEPIGRFVVYAGFQASIDNIELLCKQQNWDIIKVDGRGWSSTLNGSPADLLLEFKQGDTFKLVFIGQPGAAGMGIDLSASPSCFFYSNSFNGEDRIQAQERIHSPGMDKNRGATIIDVVHLDTDRKVLANLDKKINLMHMSMGKLKEALQ